MSFRFGVLLVCTFSLSAVAQVGDRDNGKSAVEICGIIRSYSHVDPEGTEVIDDLVLNSLDDKQQILRQPITVSNNARDPEGYPLFQVIAQRSFPVTSHCPALTCLTGVISPIGDSIQTIAIRKPEKWKAPQALCSDSTGPK